MDSAVLRSLRHRKRAARVGLLLVPAALLIAGTSEAGVGRWTTSGPWGAGGAALSLAVDPTSPSTVYAGTFGAGIFKSTDGMRWTSINDGISSLDVYDISIDPTEPSTVYAIARGTGVSKSTDGGNLWMSTNEGLTTSFLEAIVVDPVDSSILYVGGEAGKVFKSVDAAATWISAGAGISASGVHALSIDPTSHDVVYAATSSGVYKTIDGGALWSPASEGLSGSIADIAVDPTLPSTLYAVGVGGLFRSTDGAASWRPVVAGLTVVTALSVAQTSSTIYIGGAEGRVLKSRDRGASWQDVTSRVLPSGLGVPRLRRAPVSAIGAGRFRNVYVAVGGEKVTRSIDGGMTWIPTESAFGPLNLTAVAVDPVEPRIVYAAAYSALYDFYEGGGIFKSVDGGRSWHSSAAGLSNLATFRVNDLAIDPTWTSTIYAGTEGGVFRSVDSGRNWSRSTDGGASLSVRSLAIDPHAPSTLYAAGVGAVEKSVDFGQTWTPVLGIGNATATTIAIDPTLPTTVYVGTTDGAYRSLDEGGTWSRIDEGIPPNWRISAFAVPPWDPSVIYAGTIYWGVDIGILPRAGDVFRSQRGIAWTVAGTGAPRIAVGALAVDPRSPGTLYAGFGGRGIFTSTDHGEHWSSLERLGLPQWLVVNDLALSQDAQHLFAAAGGGVFQLTLPPKFGLPAYRSPFE